MKQDNRNDALYARQSVDKKDSISIESQLDFCKYETKGFSYEEYIDKGYSGKNTNRPAFERMANDIVKGKIRRVIVYKLDRISRSILDFANMMEFFEKYKVEFVSCTEKFDTSTPMGRAMLNICIVFAQLERETIQMRVTDAYYAKSHKGYYMGGRVPYGFKLEKQMKGEECISCFAPDEIKAGIISKIYNWYADADVTLGEIQRRLIDENADIEKNWCTARISEILRNPVYVKADIDVYEFFKTQGTLIISEPSLFVGTNGAFLYKGKNADGSKKKQYDLVGRELVLAPHTGIIDSRTWLRCRMKIMNNRQSARTNKAKRTWLAGKMKCKKCGYAYVAAKNVQGKRYFICSGTRYSIQCSGFGTTIYAEKMEKYVYNEMQKILLQFTYLSPEKEEINSSVMNSYQTKLAEKEKEINALLDKIPQANTTLFTYINNRVQELDEEKRKISDKMLQMTNTIPEQNFEKITDYIDKWELLSLDDKQKIVDILIKVIYIGEGEVEIEWNI